MPLRYDAPVLIFYSPVRPLRDHPHAVGARLIAAIIDDDIERNALIFFQRVCIHDVTDVHKNVRIPAVRRDETETAVIEVGCNRTCRHTSISCYRARPGAPKETPGLAARRKPTQEDGR